MADDTADAFQQILRAAEQPATTAPGSKPISKAPEVRFSMAKFDSIVNPLTVVLTPTNLKAILGTLMDEEADKQSKANVWAGEKLDTVFGYSRLVSLGLALDIWTTCKAWVHSRDQRKRGQFQSICSSKRLNDAVKKELSDLIMKDNPLALAKGFTRGFARQIIDLLDKQLVLRSPAGKVRVAQRPEEWKEQMEPLANARLFVKWIYAYIDRFFPCASLQTALSPFDLAHWDSLLGGRAGDLDEERDLLLRYFKPLAACRNVSLDDAVSGFFRVRSLAEGILQSGVKLVPTYWGRALKQREARTKYEDLALSLIHI